MPAYIPPSGKLGHAVVGFSRDGSFPETEEISAAAISKTELQDAESILHSASAEVEVGFEHRYGLLC